MRTALVTGAAGFAGSHLIELLRADGLPVFAWSRPNGPLRASTPHLWWRAVDLLDGDRVMTAVAELRPTVVYHCAGEAHVGRSWDASEETLAANVLGTAHLLNAVRRASPEARIVIPSSAMVYQPADQPLRETSPLGPTSPYGLSKLAQEMLALHAAVDDGLQVIVARSFNHIGPRQDPLFAGSSFARQIALIEAGRLKPTITVGNLETRRDLTDVRDTVRAYRALAERGRVGRVYNVCSACARPIRTLLGAMLQQARVPIKITVDPSLYRPQDSPLVLGDNERIRREIGWSPEIPFERTLVDLLGYWRDAVAASAC